MVRTTVEKRLATGFRVGGYRAVILSEWSTASVVRATGRSTARGLIFVIEFYRHMVSPLRPASCRFVPTCSQYAVDALTEYGVIRGSWLTAVRLAKCGPWHRGGWDPIPERHGCRADDVTRSESFV